MAGERSHLRGLTVRDITEPWQDLVEETLAEMGQHRSWLAKQLKVTPGAITHMLRRGTERSRLVDPTCELLGIPPPEFEDRFEQGVVEVLRYLREHDPRFVEELYERANRRYREIVSPPRSKKRKN